MTEIKGEPSDVELSAVDAKLLSPGWINLLDGAGLTYRERQVIGWALRIAPRLRRDAIAAAPDLLVALREAADLIDALDPRGGRLVGPTQAIDEVMPIIKAAIANAAGQGSGA